MTLSLESETSISHVMNLDDVLGLCPKTLIEVQQKLLRVRLAVTKEFRGLLEIPAAIYFAV